MYCNGCGARINDNNKKCPYCKQRLNLPNEPHNGLPKKTKFWDYKKILCLLFAIIPLAGYIAAYYYKKEPKWYVAILLCLGTAGLITNVLIYINIF